MNEVDPNDSTDFAASPPMTLTIGTLSLLHGFCCGVPLLLAALHLVPQSVPSISEIIASLRVRDDGQLVQVVLATGVWVCWALFTLSTAAELIGLVRGRPAPMLPRLRAFQRPAAALVAAVAVGRAQRARAATRLRKAS